MLTLPVLKPTIKQLDLLLRGFADPTRLRVLNVLAAGELCVCDIVEILGMPQPRVSRHLGYLRRCGLVDATRQWKYAHYRLANTSHAAQANLIDCVRSCFVGIQLLDEERRAAVARVAERETKPCV